MDERQKAQSGSRLPGRWPFEFGSVYLHVVEHQQPQETKRLLKTGIVSTSRKENKRQTDRNFTD